MPVSIKRLKRNGSQLKVAVESLDLNERTRKS